MFFIYNLCSPFNLLVLYSCHIKFYAWIIGDVPVCFVRRVFFLLLKAYLRQQTTMWLDFLLDVHGILNLLLFCLQRVFVSWNFIFFTANLFDCAEIAHITSSTASQQLCVRCNEKLFLGIDAAPLRKVDTRLISFSSSTRRDVIFLGFQVNQLRLYAVSKVDYSRWNNESLLPFDRQVSFNAISL